MDIDDTTGQMCAGQERGIFTTYYIVYSLLEFATGVLDGLTVSSATLSLKAADVSDNKVAHTQRVYASNWGGTIETTDWVNPTSFASADILASLSSSGLAADTRYDFTSGSAFPAAINTNGPTRLLVTSDEAVNGSAPDDDEEVYWYRSDTAGTTSDPRLTVVASTVSNPTVVAVGTEAKGSNATVTPELPGDVADNDILICFVAYRSGTPDLTQSYTKKATHTNGYANLDVWWKRASGAQTAPAVSGCTESVIAQLVSVRGATTSGDPFEAYSSTAATGTDTTQEAPSLTTTSANALVIGAISTADDNGHNITSSGNMDSIAMLSYTQNTSGTDNSLCVWSGRRATAGAIGSVVVTQVVNGADAWTHVVGAITPASSGFTGTAESTLKAPTCSASGDETFSGTSETSVQKATVTADGSETFAGTADVTTTGKVYSEGSQLDPHVGNSEITLTSVPSAVSSGELVFSAYAASSATGLVLCSAEGTYEEPPFFASGNITVAAATCSATGSMEFSGTGTSTTAPVTCDASGTYTPQVITGTCSSTMKRATCVAVGSNYLLKTTKRPTTHIGIIETDHTQNIPKMKVGVIECQ